MLRTLVPLLSIAVLINAKDYSDDIDEETKRIIENPKNEDYRSRPKSACDDGSCYPAVGDLLIGRSENLTSSSTCGLDGPSRYCIVSHLKSTEKCYWCESESKAGNRDHSVQQAITTNLPLRLKTWWQSVNAPNDTVSIELDLEAQFHFTHLIMTFKTFRPAAMVIERSNDYGKSWKPYRYFADDCDARFPEVSDLAYSQVNIDDVICDDRYSKIEPSTMGEVIYKALDPSAKMPHDPYSQRVQDWILITNLRISFTAFHTLGDDVLEPHGRSDVNQKYYYALYELIIRGNCFCYGHAEECEPVQSMYQKDEVPQHMVHGQCKCMHNTAGPNCQKCRPIYNDSPWAPAVHSTTNECQECDCNGHASSCTFSQDRWEETSMQHGGICDNCRHNTEGPTCGQCQDGYFQNMSLPLTHPEVCLECTCNEAGSVNGLVCDKSDDSGTIAGYCKCKENVMGENCDVCKPGFYNLDSSNPLGCDACNCDKLGTREDSSDICDKVSGQCDCKRNVEGDKCSMCRPEFWGLDHDEYGCKPCDCIPGASVDNVCDYGTGQCNCLNNIGGRNCADVVDEHFVPDVDYFCYEAEDANMDSGNSFPEIQRSKIDYGNSDDNKMPDYEGDDIAVSGDGDYNGSSQTGYYVEEPRGQEHMNEHTGDGFMVVDNDSILSFEPITVPKSNDYCVAVRYKIADEDPPVEATVWFTPETSNDVDSPCYNKAPGDNEISIPLYAGTKKYVQCDKKVCLDKDVNYTAKVQFNGEARIDSVIVVPDEAFLYVTNPNIVTEVADIVDQLDVSEQTDSYIAQEAEFNECVEQVIDLPKKISKACQNKLYGYSSRYFMGAKPCNCNKQGSKHQNCAKNGGQCECKPSVIGRQCEQCMPYTYGFEGGEDGCKDCNCHPDGTSDDSMCDRESGQCKCTNGVGGRQCDECKPGHYGFPHCRPCECNDHADTCDAETGECSACSDNTEGYNCHECVEGYYGDPSQSYCRECMCPDGPHSTRQYASSCMLDHNATEIAEVCQCNAGYSGPKCSVCAPGYWGNPDDQNGVCRRCDCNGNIDMVEGACDSRTGECLACKHSTTGPKCEQCLHGYWPDGNGRCQTCSCSPDGSRPDQCIDGVCGCDQENGKCNCLDTVSGQYCTECKAQFYGLIPGEGCNACNCHTSQSVLPECHQISGQCECEEGFGGRDCSGCEVGYYGIPSETGCHACQCDHRGSKQTVLDNGMVISECDLNGQCNCLPGIGGKRCDQCDYGFYTESYASYELQMPSENSEGYYCQQCDQCFDNWDKTINALKEDSRKILATAEELQRTGITGRYTRSFNDLDVMLTDVEKILEDSVSPQVENKLQQFQALRDGLNHQRGQVLRQQHLIAEVQRNDNHMRERLAGFGSQLTGLDNKLKEMQQLIDKCARETPEVAAREIDQASEASIEALREAMQLTDINDQDSQINNAINLRNQADGVVNRNLGEFEKENAQFQADKQSTLEAASGISIAELNEQICGVKTEGCDSTCGGAGCEFCGAPEGEELASACSGAATQSAQAANMARRAKESLELKLTESDAMLDKVKNANKLVEQAQNKVSETYEEADILNKKVSNKNDELIKMIQKIKLFLQEKRDNPSDILQVAEAVLSIPLPSKDQVGHVVGALKTLYTTVTDIDNQLQVSHENLQDAKRLNDKANAAGNMAREELDKTRRAEHFIEQAEQVNNEVMEGIKDYGNNTYNWEEKMNDLDSTVTNVGTKLRQVSAQILEVKQTIDSTSGKSTEISVAADAVTESTSKSKQVAKEAMDKIKGDGKVDEIINLSGIGEDKAKKWIDASQRAQSIRKRANEVRDRVQKHIETLVALEQDFRTNQNQLADKRRELEGLKSEATDIRKQLRDKLKFYSTKCGNAK